MYGHYRVPNRVLHSNENRYITANYALRKLNFVLSDVEVDMVKSTTPLLHK